MEDRPKSRRLRIARSAERLFAARGYDAVSVRDITDDANVNSALVRYYFGSKDELYRSLFTDRYAAISAERSAGLAELPPATRRHQRLRALVRLWIAPIARMACVPNDADFLMLLARDLFEGDTGAHSVYNAELDEMALECVDALAELAPDAPRELVTEAYTWMISVAANATVTRRRARILLTRYPDAVESLDGETDADAFVESMVTFITPGLAELLGIPRSTKRP